MRRLRFLIPALVLAAPLALAGCKQQAGDRCQTNDDCDSNLTCILPPGGSSLTGGTCQPANADLGVEDMAGPAQDLSSMDDLSSGPDLSGDLATHD
jgi:hypothetical protein